jgi:adenosylcobinamide-GDP ribazoletransferase
MVERERVSEFQSIQTAFGLLSRIPLGGGASPPGAYGRAVAYFPLVGLVMGALGGMAAWLLSSFLPPWPAAIGLMALFALLTGGLHLDGLADTADGLGGGRGDRSRILRIMRDSRLGSFGAVALVIVMLGKISGFAALIGDSAVDGGVGGPGGGHVFWGLVLMACAGRWCGVLLIRVFPYARARGLGRRFRDESGSREFLLASATLGVALLMAGQGGPGTSIVSSIMASIAAAVSALLIGVWAYSRIGGLTGDVYGAGIEVAELVFLWMYIV